MTHKNLFLLIDPKLRVPAKLVMLCRLEWNGSLCRLCLFLLKPRSCAPCLSVLSEFVACVVELSFVKLLSLVSKLEAQLMSSVCQWKKTEKTQLEKKAAPPSIQDSAAWLPACTSAHSFEMICTPWDHLLIFSSLSWFLLNLKLCFFILPVSFPVCGLWYIVWR